MHTSARARALLAGSLRPFDPPGASFSGISVTRRPPTNDPTTPAIAASVQSQLTANYQLYSPAGGESQHEDGENQHATGGPVPAMAWGPNSKPVVVVSFIRRI
jgi:hypothetical protein